MMGHSLQNFLYNRVPNDKNIMRPIPSAHNRNLKLRTVVEPEKSFILDEIADGDIEDYMHSGTVFYRQKLGLRVRDFEKESRINKRYQIVATYKTSLKTSSTPKIVDD